jgi:serine/threonine-protein kinase
MANLRAVPAKDVFAHLEDPDEGDSLLAFRDEDALAENAAAGDPGAPQALPQPKVAPVRVPAAVIAIVAVAAVGGAIAYARMSSAPRPAPEALHASATGAATIEAEPAGDVKIDGVPRGTTPLTVSLSPGAHTLEITSGGATRTLALPIEAGQTIRQAVAFPVAPTARIGQLSITSEPTGAHVAVDGVASGVTPVTLSGVHAGEHHVTISNDSATIRQTVKLGAGETASVTGNLSGAGAAGWATFVAPFDLDVLEDGQLVGTTAANRIMLPSGLHHIELKSTRFEAAATMSVRIVAGETAKVVVPVPAGVLSINATPWAAVSIDGRDVGETPIGNLAVPAGVHEIVLKNPQLGERRRSVDVTAHSPTRVGVDLTK